MPIYAKVRSNLHIYIIIVVNVTYYKIYIFNKIIGEPKNHHHSSSTSGSSDSSTGPRAGMLLELYTWVTTSSSEAQCGTTTTTSSRLPTKSILPTTV